MKEFDYIVIGGGAGGCALAGRLSEDPAISVCLLEAGKSDDQTLIKVPFGTLTSVPGDTTMTVRLPRDGTPR